MDAETTIQTLRDEFAQFVAERDWEQFHSPKNLAMSLAIEAAELMEHFQWISPEESRTVSNDAGERSALAAEMADVLCYLLGLANATGIDLSAAFREKMESNRVKYPAGPYRGRWKVQ
jgi:NTP pyrophosphatase (non-canonical NTP hydrolase)